MEMKRVLPTVEAHGGHIIIDCFDIDFYFITPMCPYCNAQHNKILPLLKVLLW